ncbi:uncharacterized hydrophobic domain-containing protein [Actinokineospora alba]|uniref:Uncharacterized hydrophobic domain-containing protein n=1 Tax=Actinokineospora alba TaxID=504798 RepID=A0A1H0TMR4_9PSEU|nr:DUF389 domain-containing protein [Actinokineospora alba]TDP70595.1 putative hydrophobic protein (TIGR00271 family) [Actinokineospora alba]SDJ11246.1 uncharacterized hydrophobic domain-containing protein [Actinokineospora alba]SDP54980.1 uncharacterized hydrophobic domain-containing protein [Actinokineospora alba]
MLRLRAVCPPESSKAALDVLQEHVGATHVVLFPGAAIQPAGDVIEADVAREAADEILAVLCSLGIDHTGGITLDVIDTVMSDAADLAERDAPGEAADAVVWEELVSRTGEESRLNATYLAFLIIACLLAAVGVITDSPITIVGAMVVGPEFGPLAAIAVGLVRGRWDLVRRASLALGLGFVVAIAITAGGTWLGWTAGLFDASAIVGDHQVDFVYEVGPWSLIVAVLAGAAGMLSMTSAKSAALVGVFISVTTVPAAGYIAVAAILGEWQKVLDSAGQLTINLLGIVVAASAVLMVRRSRRFANDAVRPLSPG